MLPDNDGRHGTNAGYGAGCRCDDCRAASTAYHKRLYLEHHRGRRRMVDATGTRRRIEALMRLGYSGQKIAEAVGRVDWDEVRQYRTRPQVYRATAEKVARAYEELSMTLPIGTTRYERQIISRTRNYAARNGFLPPLAWDDVDNPDERPATEHQRPTYSRDELLAEWDWLRRTGESMRQAADRLGVTVDAIEKAVERDRRSAA